MSTVESIPVAAAGNAAAHAWGMLAPLAADWVRAALNGRQGVDHGLVARLGLAQALQGGQCLLLRHGHCGGVD